jgi:hypothetical protein
MSEGIQKPNCGNCPNFKDDDCSLLNEWLSGDELGMTLKIGCLSHPNTRAYLMAPVIAELERRVIKCGLHEDYNKAETYNKAIKFIRDGVKRDKFIITEEQLQFYVKEPRNYTPRQDIVPMIGQSNSYGTGWSK